MVVQLLIPLQEDKGIFIISAIGAGISIVLNILLVSYLLSIGSAIAYLVAEIAVLLGAYYYIRKRIGLTLDYKDMMQYAISYIPLILLCIVISYFSISGLYKLFIVCIITVLYTHFLLFNVLKNNTYSSYVKKYLQKMTCKKYE